MLVPEIGFRPDVTAVGIHTTRVICVPPVFKDAAVPVLVLVFMLFQTDTLILRVACIAKNLFPLASGGASLT